MRPRGVRTTPLIRRMSSPRACINALSHTVSAGQSGVLPRSSVAALIGAPAPSACDGQDLGIGAERVRQVGGRSHPGARQGRAGIEDAKGRNEAAQALELRGVHFGDHKPVGGLDLPPSKIFVADLREPVQGVDRYDDLTHHDVMLQDRVCDDGVDDPAGVGKPAGLEHDVVNSRADASPPTRSSQMSRSNATSAGRVSQQAQPPARTRSRVEPVSKVSSTGASAASLTTTRASRSKP